jgi:hypothetical protein
MSRRELGQTLAEIGAGLQPLLAQAARLNVRRVAVDLPLEFALRGHGAATQVLGELPRCVTRTAFDTTPSRLVAVWEARP